MPVLRHVWWRGRGLTWRGPAWGTADVAAPAAPPTLARQCRALIRGAAGPYIYRVRARSPAWSTCATRFDSTIQVLCAGGRRSGQVVWLRGWYIYGPAAPRIRARHCRAKVGGAAGAATSAVPQASPRHVSPLPRHHAWRGTGIWPRQGNRRGQKC